MGGGVTWPACIGGEELACVGVQAGPDGQCWAHLTPDALRDALGALSPGKDLDLRGTALDWDLLEQILDALRDPQDGRPRVGNGRFEHANFSGGKLSDGVLLNGVVFSGEVSFWNATFSGWIQFRGVKFEAGVAFNGAMFHESVVFENVNFRAGVGFAEATFADDVSFNGTTFGAGASFERVKFGDLAVFGGAVFGGDARFEFAKFTGFTDFAAAKFGGEARFSRAEFGHYARFAGTFFERDAVFGGFLGGAKFRRDVDFEEVKFRGIADFEGVEFSGDATFSLAEFGKEARFIEARVGGAFRVGPSMVGGVLNLSGVKVDGVVRIVVAASLVGCASGEFASRVWLSLEGGDLRLVDSVFARPATVESLSPSLGIAGMQGDPGVALLSLRGTDAEHLTLVDVDLSRCVLSGLRRPELLRLDGRCAFARVPRGFRLRWGWVPWRWTAREALFEEHLWRRSVPGNGSGWAGHGPGEDEDGSPWGVVGPARLTVLYRQLRAALEDSRDAPGAADLYYGEMEMRRLASWRWSERWLLRAYWLVSGYGLRAWRALAMLTLFVLAAAVVLDSTGFAGRSPGLAASMLYAAGSVVSLDVVVQHVPVVLTEWGEAARLLLRVGGPVLLGLAALALRGRVKR